MRLASLTSVPNSELSNYVILERPTASSWKYMSQKSCRESRPPLRSDLQGPTPCTYSARLPSNAIHGTKISPKTKYSRNALPYPTTDLWTFNVAVSGKSPTPCSYTAPNVLGRSCPIKREAPSFTMGTRTIKPMLNKPGADKDPAPTAYNCAQSMEYVFERSPSFSIQVKREGRHGGSTPGPAHYRPDRTPTLNKSPAFTMGYRRHRITSNFNGGII